MFLTSDLRAYHCPSHAVSHIWATIYNTASPLLQSPPISSSVMSVNPSPELKSLFEVALDEFEKRAGTNLLQHQIFDRLVNCQSADSVIDVLQDQAQATRNIRGDDGRLMTWLKRTVNVLHAISTSSLLREGIGMVRPITFHQYTPSNIFLFSISRQQKQFSPGLVYFLAYVSYLGSIEQISVTSVTSTRRSKIISARVTMPWSISSNPLNLSLGASISIQGSHPPRR